MHALVPILFVVTAFFSDEYPVWRTGRAPDQPFTVECEIRFPEETIKYPFKDQIIFQALNENKASSAYTQTSKSLLYHCYITLHFSIFVYGVILGIIISYHLIV